MSIVPYIWIIFGLLLSGAEFFFPGFVIFFFGIGAVLTGLISAILPVLRPNVPLQLILWLVSSGFSLFALRRYFARAFKGKLISGLDDSSVIGSSATVIEDITPEKAGRIKFQGTTWTAVSYNETLPAGTTVEILQKEGLTYTVTASIMRGE